MQIVMDNAADFFGWPKWQISNQVDARRRGLNAIRWHAELDSAPSRYAI